LAILATNLELKQKGASDKEVTKRKYTQRRSWLEKKYKCAHELCGNTYSSKIALNLHIRKRHNQIKVEE
jgi:hypothetical protein